MESEPGFLYQEPAIAVEVQSVTLGEPVVTTVAIEG
jgi:hypothetical protein